MRPPPRPRQTAGEAVTVTLTVCGGGDSDTLDPAGQGKRLVMSLMLSLILKQGIRMAVGSLDSQPGR